MAKTQKTGAGELTEAVTILSPTPIAVAVMSITRVGTVVTVVTMVPHGFTDGDFVTFSGVTPAGYNGEFPIDVTGASSFTFTVTGSPATPATVQGSVVFTSDAQGGGGSGWWTLAIVAGQMTPLSASEQLAAQAVNSTQTYTVKIYYRPDVTPAMRLSWVPYRWSTAKTLEIHGVLPDKDEPRRFLVLSLGEAI